jgi:hypothetical protein
MSNTVNHFQNIKDSLNQNITITFKARLYVKKSNMFDMSVKKVKVYS